jgi:pimeloyl-ACP methyl ester carboxylesterase
MGATMAPTQFVKKDRETYAYRRFGSGAGLPLLCLQHFTGTLDNWDPAVVDTLAAGRDVILFENAGLGRSSGVVPETIGGMARHALAFVDTLGLKAFDMLGYSLGGMVAQQLALDRPGAIRRLILAATSPRGGEDIMHMEKPSLAQFFQDPKLTGYARLQKLFFAPSETSQAAGAAFVQRLEARKDDLDPRAGPAVPGAQIATFREWEQFAGERFSDLKSIRCPVLVVNGIHDEMIPIVNSYRLAEKLPDAMLIAYPDSGHGALFQFHQSFSKQAAAFLDSTALYAPY